MKFTEMQYKIVDKSIDLISEKGIQGFTIKNLANKLNLTEGAIYRHFKSKEDILLSIIKIFQEEAAVTLDNACSREHSAIEKITEIFNHHFSFFAEKPSVASVIFSEAIFQNKHSLSKEVHKLLQMHENALLCIIESGQASGELINGNIRKEELVKIIIGSIRYTVTKWRLSNFQGDIKKEGKKLLKTIKYILTRV